MHTGSTRCSGRGGDEPIGVFLLQGTTESTGVRSLLGRGLFTRTVERWDLLLLRITGSLFGVLLPGSNLLGGHGRFPLRFFLCILCGEFGASLRGILNGEFPAVARSVD